MFRPEFYSLAEIFLRGKPNRGKCWHMAAREKLSLTFIFLSFFSAAHSSEKKQFSLWEITHRIFLPTKLTQSWFSSSARPFCLEQRLNWQARGKALRVEPFRTERKKKSFSLQHFVPGTIFNWGCRRHSQSLLITLLFFMHTKNFTLPKSPLTNDLRFFSIVFSSRTTTATKTTAATNERRRDRSWRWSTTTQTTGCLLCTEMKIPTYYCVPSR